MISCCEGMRLQQARMGPRVKTCAIADVSSNKFKKRVRDQYRQTLRKPVNERMSTFHCITPENTRDLRVLFIFAHPDDEVFVGGAMRMLLDYGADVYGVWLTSGDFFGPGEKREKEHSGAMEALGLARDHIRLLRLPDMRLIHSLEQGVSAVTQLIERIHPDEIYVTAYEGGHPDHDSANFVAYESTRRAGVRPLIREYPLYNGTGPILLWRWRINSFPPDGPEPETIPLNKRAVDCKHRIMRNYPSQWLYMGPARITTLSGKMLSTGEPVRTCPWDRDHTQRPHTGKLNYERWFNRFMKISFKDFRRAVEHVTTYR